MVPAAYAGAVVMRMADHLESGDVIIDGGNTHYPDDIARATALEPRASTTSTSARAAGSSASNEGTA